MRVLGIDPAIRTTGYAVLEIDSAGKYAILDCGVICNKPKAPHSECVRRLAGGVNELIDKFHPDHAAMEAPFVGRNASTAIILGMARGAIMAALALRDIPVYAYSPATAKKAATGHGAATKEQIAYLLSGEFGIAIDEIPLDSTDAIAIALCHLAQARNPELLGQSL